MSKFKGIFENAKASESEVEEGSSRAEVNGVGQEKAIRRGRPGGGKRSSGDYVQVTAYIPRDLHRDAKIALLQTAEEKDFSDLVGDLLRDWLHSRT